MSHIQLNYAFLLFWGICEEIHRELLFSPKFDYFRKDQRNNQEVYFS